jgi:hypothetical protein
MTCEIVRFGGGHAFVCSRGQRPKRCKFCGEAATLQCDYPLRGHKQDKTCDAHMCRGCGTQQPVTALHGDTVDYCPPHARLATRETSSG